VAENAEWVALDKDRRRLCGGGGTVRWIGLFDGGFGLFGLLLRGGGFWVVTVVIWDGAATKTLV